MEQEFAQWVTLHRVDLIVGFWLLTGAVFVYTAAQILQLLRWRSPE